jgi:hypothetical protein
MSKGRSKRSGHRFKRIRNFEHKKKAEVTAFRGRSFLETILDPDLEADVDLRLNWNAFCDCDHFDGRETFTDRMEAAGLIELAPVDDEALEDAFAQERGIVRGGYMWRLSTAGRAAMAK